jgi:NAD(P)-dependent dehydrogenase (short-subunit alcohol dehydrogenase family)
MWPASDRESGSNSRSKGKEDAMRLAGKVALIAGGGQGIGEGIVRCIAEEGADVAICDINAENAKKVAEVCQEMGQRALAVAADLTADEGVEKTIKETIGFFGRIDILVNNVGGSSAEMMRILAEHSASLSDPMLPPYMRFNGELWDRFYRLNLKSHAMLSNAVTPHLINQRSGSIVNVASISGRNPDPGNIAYAACKAGDISLTWSMARALAPYKVRVNCICPGLVWTPLWEMGASALLGALRTALAQGQQLPGASSQILGENLEDISPRDFWLKYIVQPLTPLGVEQTPEDMGRAVVFLVSDDAKNITGQILHIDGGQVTR